MKQKLDSKTCVFGARQICAHLAAFSDEIEGARQNRDQEHIHQLRVFSRRLRSTLPLFQKCLPAKKSKRWFGEVKQITTSLGKARDLDVQIIFLQNFAQNLPDRKYQLGIERLILRLSQKREKVQAKVIKALDELEASGTLEEMSQALQPMMMPEEQTQTFPLELYQLACDSIEQALHSFLAYEPYIFQPEKVKELHEMRIAAKNLRYTVEVFSTLYTSKLKSAYQAVRESQDLLGTIHDMDVWGTYIPSFIEQESKKIVSFYGKATPFNFILPGLTFFEQQVKIQRDQTYQQFTTAWPRWKADGVWEKLLGSIRMPEFPKDAVASTTPTDSSSES